MTFSFIIPAYNAERTIAKCLDSILTQQYTDFKIIVINDGSTDDTARIINRYAQRDQRILPIFQVNKGPGLARNNGLWHVTTDFVAFVDADDYIEPNYLTLAVRTINKHTSDVVIIDNYYEQPNGKIIRIEKQSRFKHLNKQQIISRQMTGKMPWGGTRKIIRTKLIRDNHISYSEDPIGEESIFSFQVLDKAKNINFIDKPVYHYVNYPTSQSKKGDDDPWGAIVKKMQDYLITNGLYEKYETALTSFALSALAASANRISQNHPYREAKIHLREQVEKYKRSYSTKFDRRSLDYRKYAIWICLKHSLYYLVYLSCSLHNKRNNLNNE